MGYKSVLRSMSAAGNRASKIYDREQRQKQKHQERLQKKVKILNEKKEAIFEVLDSFYAQGKIDKKEYDKLKLRQADIDVDLILLGKAAGSALGKRYISGKIDKEEFEKIKKEIYPAQFNLEKEMVAKEISKLQKEFEAFDKKCKRKIKDVCQHCGKAKHFLDPIKKLEAYELCRKCRSVLSKIMNFSGFKGDYVEVERFKFDLNALKENNLRININLAQQVLENS